MKQCKVCNKLQMYDPVQTRKSKASGFMGKVCWACHLVMQAARLGTLEKRAKQNAASIIAQKRNPGRVNAKNMAYKIAKMQRVPIWANLAKIAEVYNEAVRQKLTVDHIYPLRGKTVSGLHVHNNLQLLSRSANASKGNSHAA